MVRKNVQEQIRYLDNKRKFKKILREKRVLNEYAQSGLFAAIGGPLGDIFKSLKLVAMDISNELRWLGEQFLYRNNPQELEKARGDYQRKHDKLLKQWEPIVKSSMDAIKNADPFFTIALSPGLFLASKGIQTGVAAGKGAAEIIAAEDWESLRARMNKFQMDTPDNPNAGSELGMGAIYGEMRKQNNLLIRLNDLFMGAPPGARPAAGGGAPATGGTALAQESIIREQEESSDEPAPKITDPKEWLDTLFELTGIDQEFTDVATELLQGKIDLMQEMIPTIESTTAVTKLVATSDLDNFTRSIADIVSKNKISKEAISGLGKVMPEIEDQAKKLAGSEDFRKELATAEKISPDALDDKNVFEKARSVVFKQAKTKFDEQYETDLAEFREVIKKSHEEIETDDQTLDLVKQRTDIAESAEFIEVYDQYAKAYKDFKGLK